MFKLIQLLARFVVRAYEKEADKLHRATATAASAHTELVMDHDQLEARQHAEYYDMQVRHREEHVASREAYEAAGVEVGQLAESATAAEAKAAAVRAALL